MAQCPQCADSPLVHAMLSENLAAHCCGKCLGTLVSLVAYRAWRERGDAALLAAVPIAVADVEAADSTAAKKCPKCRSLMSKYRISAEQSNRLDYCPHCEEVWLDDGEWRLVEALARSGDFARVFTQAWQHGVTLETSEAMEEERLRARLGADYQRTADFAEWVNAHPDRLTILARVSRRK